MRKAEGFVDAADGIATLDDSGEARDAVVTLYVHAGIAAADAICCATLGVHSSGDNHAEAIALLEKAARPEARHLATLLGMKTKAGYSHRPASEGDAKRAARAAVRLVESARAVTH
jgi:hypothetical protein